MTDRPTIQYFSITKEKLGGFEVSPNGDSDRAAFTMLEEAFNYIRQEWGVVPFTAGPLPPDFKNVFESHRPELISVVDESGLRQQNAQLADNLLKAEEARDVATREFKRALVLLRSICERNQTVGYMKKVIMDADAFIEEFKDVT